MSPLSVQVFLQVEQYWPAVQSATSATMYAGQTLLIATKLLRCVLRKHTCLTRLRHPRPCTSV